MSNQASDEGGAKLLGSVPERNGQKRVPAKSSSWGEGNVEASRVCLRGESSRSDLRRRQSLQICRKRVNARV